MFMAANAIASIASTLVTGDRTSDLGALSTNTASTTGNAVYNRGQSEFAQVLTKVEPEAQTLQDLKDNDQLALPADSTLANLIQAAAQQTPGASTPTLNTAALQQALQNGGQQLLQASRLGLNLNTMS
jgi:hypothetical protein